MKSSSKHTAPHLALPSLLLTLGFVAGCSSIPEPIGEMASARTAVRNMNSSDAPALAPVEADRASTKLKRAEDAIAEESFDKARRLANEATADAELAVARTNAAKAQRAATEIEENIRVLRSELDRAQSAQ